MGVDFRFAARSDIGLVRKQNQDSGYAGHHLLIVADGMGGPAGGDIASSVVVGQLAPLDEDPAPADQLLSCLHQALQEAHDHLVERSNNDAALRGLGTTCVAVYRSGNKLGTVHVGDSRGYLLRNGQLAQVTKDHSLVQYLVDNGQITQEEAEHHPKRSVILRVIGDTSSPVEPDESVREAIVGDRWLLCSDGLHGVVSRETIVEVLSSEETPEECVDKLIELALLAGAPDNVTCVVGDVVEEGKEPPTHPQIVGSAAVNRHEPTRGSDGAAGRAAELLEEAEADKQSTSTEIDEDGGEDKAGKNADSRGKRKRLWWLLAGIIVGILVVSGELGWQWSQSRFYAQAEDGQVVIYQGIPTSFGPLELSHQVEQTDLGIADLAPIDQTRLQEPVTRGSRAELDAYLAEVAERADSLREQSTLNGGNADEAQSGDS